MERSCRVLVQDGMIEACYPLAECNIPFCLPATFLSVPLWAQMRGPLVLNAPHPQKISPEVFIYLHLVRVHMILFECIIWVH